MMKNDIFRKNIYLLGMFLSCFFCFNYTHAQSNVDEDAELYLNKCMLSYFEPKNYYSIKSVGDCSSIHPDFHQGAFFITLINKENQIRIAISMIDYPKPTNKINKYLIANVDMNHFSEKAVAAQIDTTLSKMMDIEALHLKKMNADRGIIYNIKVDGKYLGIYPRCKKIEVYKDNTARVELLFFYKENQENQVRDEIEKTWGMLRFK
ncbi:hypothetical protein K5V07_12895 [Flavobacterium sp. CHNK8]|uniref:hypothetical protein n=1 Tax=Flavobacterium sp. CHNK8 TaxID=2871165 RepID=UPI001C8DAC73|nr:hypothetical protein [Flavobacterium sp. CHNK8]QZK91340.1 hypothetical protein K5V07_12895 [Flavobacterium sp. CHNK8]